MLLDEDDINLGSQSRNIEENNELNITSTTKAIIEHLTNVPCDPSACTSLPGYEFCQPLLSEERECCPSQYECNVSTTTDGPITTVIVAVSETDSEPSTAAPTESEITTQQSIEFTSEEEVKEDNDTDGETITELVSPETSSSASTTVSESVTNTGTESSSTGIDEGKTSICNIAEETTSPRLIESDNQEISTESDTELEQTDTVSTTDSLETVTEIQVDEEKDELMKMRK